MQKNHYVVKMNGNQVQLYRNTGSYVRAITTGAKSAILQGEEVHVTMSDTHVRIYTVNGTFKRTI